MIGIQRVQGIWPSFFLLFLNQRDLIKIRGAKKTGDICFEKLLLLCVSINEINIEEKISLEQSFSQCIELKQIT